MNIQIQEMTPKCEKEEALFVGGTKMGYIKTYPDESRLSRYHVGFHLGAGLIQGFGTTPEEAVVNAISKGRSGAVRLLAEIESLEVELGKAN